MSAYPPPLPEAARTGADGAREDAAALAEALGKLLVFASVYPADHVRVTSLARPLAEAIARRASDETPCVVAVTADGLLVDEEPVATTTVAKRHLRRDIASLSLFQVDFFRTITASDLIGFANLVRITTRRGTGRRTFEEPCLPGLPPSIAARFSDFGTPEFGTAEKGVTWCGETLEPQAASEVESPAQVAAGEDWQRLTRLLVTDLLAVIDSGDAGVGVSDAAAPAAGPDETGGAATPSADAGDLSAPPGSAGDQAGTTSSGRAGTSNALPGEPSAADSRGVAGPAGGATPLDAAGTAGGAAVGGAAGPAAALGTGATGTGSAGSTTRRVAGAPVGLASPGAATARPARGAGAGTGGTGGPRAEPSPWVSVPTSASETPESAKRTRPLTPSERSLTPHWLGALAEAAGAGGTARADRPGVPGGTSSVQGSGRGGTRAGRSVGRKRAGAPGLAPEDGYRARGSRERVRAIEEAVRRAVERAIVTHGEVRSVSRVVEEARRLLPLLAPELPLERVLEGIREALDEHLRDSFRTEGGASFDAARQPAREAAPCKLPLAELLKRLSAVAPTEADAPPTQTADAAEQLSILLYMLEEERRPGVVDGIKARLFSRLSRALDDEETTAMGGWIESLCASGRPVALADRLLPVLFEQLRRAAPACTIAVLLRALQTPRPPVIRTLWPHLAVELLYGLDGATESAREQTVGRMEGVTAELLRSETPRFSALVVAGRGHFSPRYLSTPRRRLRSFHELILGLPDTPELAASIVTAYRTAPPPNSPARALVAIRSEEHAQKYLQHVLREELDGGESPSLRHMGAGIVAAALHALTRGERRAPWVAEAIRALDSLRTPFSLEVVEEILRSRRWLILWEWPKACRRAAFAVRAFFRLEQVAASARATNGLTQ